MRMGLGLGLTRLGGGGFNPAKLFAASEPGVWYDPSDISTMFQDTAGTTPVTAAGQSVGLVLDKSGRGNHATQAVFASRPLYQVDASGRGYLAFDGVDDFLVTPTITPGTDKAQVFAGVRKLSDAGQSIVVELSTNFGANNGVFSLQGTNIAATYAFGSKGSISKVAVTTANFGAPITSVLTGIGDVSGDNAKVRVNANDAANEFGDQGTGNFLAYPLYIGRRGGTSLPFNGHLYGLQVRFGPNLTADQIAQTERWMAARTGVSL